MKYVRLFLLVLATAMCTISGFAQDVHTDYDHHANFERFHTYSWMKVASDNPLWQQRISDAVDQDLQAKGWQKVPEGGDIAITAVGAVQNQQEYQTFYSGFGRGWRWGGFGPETTTNVVNYRVGELVVDLYDQHSQRLVWRGTSSDTLSDKPEKNEEKLDKAVKKMFDKFPPEEKG